VRAEQHREISAEEPLMGKMLRSKCTVLIVLSQALLSQNTI